MFNWENQHKEERIGLTEEINRIVVKKSIRVELGKLKKFKNEYENFKS